MAENLSQVSRIYKEVVSEWTRRGIAVRITLPLVSSEVLRDHLTNCPIAPETLEKACVSG